MRWVTYVIWLLIWVWLFYWYGIWIWFRLGWAAEHLLGV